MGWDGGKETSFVLYYQNDIVWQKIPYCINKKQNYLLSINWLLNSEFQYLYALVLHKSSLINLEACLEGPVELMIWNWIQNKGNSSVL